MKLILPIFLLVQLAKYRNCGVFNANTIPLWRLRHPTSVGYDGRRIVKY